MSSPAAACSPPETSETAITVAPSPCSSAAAMPPTFPKPWTTQRCSASDQPSRSHARAMTMTTPAPVASCRNTEPPIEIGLPVTISGTAYPRCIEYVSIIHAIVCSFVAMSGAGMSSCGPMIGRSSEVKRRVRRSSSPSESSARVAADSALGAAVGEAQERALPRHPHRERRALAERHLGVVADPALRRPRDARVLDAVAGEDDAPPVVHSHRDRDDRRPLGERRRSAMSSGMPATGPPDRTARPPCGRAACPTRAGHGQALPAGSPRPAESSGVCNAPPISLRRAPTVSRLPSRGPGRRTTSARPCGKAPCHPDARA